MASGDHSSVSFPGAHNFRTTHWSVVLLAQQEQAPQSFEAMETLCRTYWFPLYAFVRRKGHDPDLRTALAQTVMENVLARLRSEFDRPEKRQRFDELKVFLLGDPDGPSYAGAAERLQMTEQAVKSAVHRLRQRYAELVRAEIAHTVSSPEEIEGEIRSLFAALGD